VWFNSYRGSIAFKNFLIDYGIKVWEPFYKQINYEGEEEKVWLFPGYFFAYCTGETAIFVEQYCRDLGNFSTKFLKTDKGKPIPLKEDEIEHVKDLEKKEIKLESGLAIGQKVLVRGGPLSNVESLILEIRGDNIKVGVTIFCRCLELWVKECNCIKIEKKVGV
jgi:transcription antitermination factor NusG